MSTSNGRLPTPEWFKTTWIYDLLGSGTYGFVFDATLRTNQNVNVAAKVVFNQENVSFREIHVTNLLTEVFTHGPTASAQVETPVVKYYDAGISRWSRTEIVNVFDEVISSGSAGLVSPESKKRFEAAIQTNEATIPIAIMMMNVSGRKSVHQMITQQFYFDDVSDFEKGMIEILCQLLCTLDLLGNKLKFNHLDFGIQNVFVRTHRTPRVYKFVDSGGNIFHIRSKYQIQIADFSESRLEFGEQQVHPDDSAYKHLPGVTRTDSEFFAPWIDLHTFALSFIAYINPSRLKSLDQKSPLFSILSLMLTTILWESTAHAELPNLLSLLPPPEEAPKDNTIDYSLQLAQLICVLNGTKNMGISGDIPSLPVLSWHVRNKLTSAFHLAVPIQMPVQKQKRSDDPTEKRKKTMSESRQITMDLILSFLGPPLPPPLDNQVDYSQQVDQLIAKITGDKVTVDVSLPSLAVVHYLLLFIQRQVRAFDSVALMVMAPQSLALPNTSYELLQQRAMELRHMVFSPLSDRMAPNPSFVLSQAANAFSKFRTYTPTDTDIVYDFTLSDFDPKCVSTLIPWSALQRTAQTLALTLPTPMAEG